MKLKENLESVYLKLPPMIQNLLVSVEGKRIVKRRYDDKYEERELAAFKRDTFTREQLRKYQNKRLRNLFHIASTSEYWNHIFKIHDVNISSEDMFLELKKLPILNKNQVKESSSYITPNLENTNDVINVKTSGTTGSSLQFMKTREAEHEQWAVWWRYRNWHGIDRDTLCGQFAGKIIVPMENEKTPFWRINRPGKQILFSSYHINDKTASEYIKAINEYEIPWLHGFPSALALLAGYMIEQGLESTPKVKVVTIGSEGIQSHQKTLIEKAFGAKVFQHYGLAEGVANISECENGNLHVDEDFSFVEFIPTSQNNIYKLIGTNFSNLAFPLIRYDSSDLVRINENIKCSCNKTGRIITEIDGRNDDYIVLPNGTKVARLGLIFQTNKYIKEAQIVQKQLNEVYLNIVPIVGFKENSEEDLLLSQAKKWLGNDIKIIIRYVDSIPKTKNGKLKLVISELNE